jgi:hypothetical protein
MDGKESPNHMRWECTHPVVCIPKCRRKKPYLPVRQDLGEVSRELVQGPS